MTPDLTQSPWPITPNTPAYLVEARHLTKRYGSRIVVNDVALAVAAGEVVGLIGPNGAGKSTTLELILGLRAPDGGEIVFGLNQPRQRIGVQLQTPAFFRGLTAAENLRLFAAFYGVRLSRQAVADLLAQCGLTDVARVEASKLSGGQQKRLAIALALAHAPRLLFLDEPTAALDPRARHEIRTLIHALTAQGVAVVFTSHDMEEVGKLADRVVLLLDGCVRAQGTPAALLAEYHVGSLEELYLQLTAQETYP